MSTVTLNVEVPYTDNDGLAQFRTCVLALSTEDMAAITEGEEGEEQISIQGAVMPVGSGDPGAN
ncbi:MAG TPA: hypothetical protein VH394_06550 [Thermoanaerobaculia bacterium]|jgi:hypothetical protein|nr:hypothetical protein [Thermoanaerobaculia bacterium]